MSERILITAALPYANGSIHLGHIVEYLQADIYTRFLKLMGKDAIYLCADDTHGTPIYIKARNLNITPEELISKYSKEHQQDFKDFQIAFDYYHSTHSPENEKHSLFIFNELTYRKHITKRDVEQYYCEQDKMFLSDRFIKGACPACKTKDQYGDVCENCGFHYDPTDLIEPCCSLCGTTPVIKSSAHYFFKLSDFNSKLLQWTRDEGCLQSETINSIRDWLTQGLKDWDISRDAPYFGFKIPGEENKYFYVWLDAPVGYIAATEKFCEKTGKDFDSYWHNKGTKIYHFIGKDIVYFHTLFWPAMLMGSGYNLPNSIFVHGFLTVNGKKMSKTKGTFITARRYLECLDPQYLRYYFASKLSGNSDDIDLNLDDFQVKVNTELINNIINMGSRAVSMLNRDFNGVAGQMRDNEQKMFAGFIQEVDLIQMHYSKREYSKAIRLILEISDKTNRYFSDGTPWKLISGYPEAAHAICTFALNAFRLISVVLKPVVPALSADIETILNLRPQRWDDAKAILPEGSRVQMFRQILTRVETKSIDQLGRPDPEDHNEV